MPPLLWKDETVSWWNIFNLGINSEFRLQELFLKIGAFWFEMVTEHMCFTTHSPEVKLK